jgi:hypothetical protein
VRLPTDGVGVESFDAIFRVATSRASRRRSWHGSRSRFLRAGAPEHRPGDCDACTRCSVGQPCRATAPPAPFRGPAAVDDDQLRHSQSAPDEIVERRAASLSPPMLLIASSIFWPSARTPSATSNEIGCLSVEPYTHDRPVDDQPHDRLFGERARIPGVPAALRLAPDGGDAAGRARSGSSGRSRRRFPATSRPRSCKRGYRADGGHLRIEASSESHFRRPRPSR